MAFALDALRRAALVGADGRAFTPREGNGLDTAIWGEDQANKQRFATDVNYIANMGKPGMGFLSPNSNKSPLPTQWEVMGNVVQGRNRAIEGAGGTAQIADPLRSRPTRIPAGATRSLTSGTLAGGGGGNDEGEAPVAASMYGSGADAEIERKRKELALAGLDEGLTNARLRGQDIDGSQARSVARGRAIADERHDLEYVAPQRQRLTNSITALARAAGREEREKDFASQEPERNYADTQYQARYVTPAQVRADAAVEAARLGGASREGVATTNAGGRVDAARLGALGKVAQEATRGGQAGTATAVRDQIEPVNPVAQAIEQLQSENPDATPEEIFDALGPDLTEEEAASAMRLLGRTRGPGPA